MLVRLIDILSGSNVISSNCQLFMDPNIARRSDGKVSLHLQAAADVTAGWRNLIVGLKTRRTVLGVHTA